MVETLKYLVAAAPLVVAGAAFWGWVAGGDGWGSEARRCARGRFAMAGLTLRGFRVRSWRVWGPRGRSLRAFRGAFALQRALGGWGDREGIAFPRKVEPEKDALGGRGRGRGGAVLRVRYGVRGRGGHQRPDTAVRGVRAAPGRGLSSWGQWRCPGVRWEWEPYRGGPIAGLTFEELSDASASQPPPLPCLRIATLMLAGGWAGVSSGTGFELCTSQLSRHGPAAGEQFVPRCPSWPAPSAASSLSGFLLPRDGPARGLEVPVWALPLMGSCSRCSRGQYGIVLVKTLAESLGPVFAGPGLRSSFPALFAGRSSGWRGGEWPRRRPGPSGSGSRRRVGECSRSSSLGRLSPASGAAAILASGSDGVRRTLSGGGAGDRGTRRVAHGIERRVQRAVHATPDRGRAGLWESPSL